MEQEIVRAIYLVPIAIAVMYCMVKEKWDKATFWAVLFWGAVNMFRG